MTTDAEIRLIQWIENYGSQKQPIFIADLKAVMEEVARLRRVNEESRNVLELTDQAQKVTAKEMYKCKDEIKKLQEMVKGLVDRVAKQSELLSRKAEVK